MTQQHSNSRFLMAGGGTGGHVIPALAVARELKARGHEAYKLHRTVARPWGAYTTLEEGPGFKIKRIEVKKAGSLSSAGCRPCGGRR